MFGEPEQIRATGKQGFSDPPSHPGAGRLVVGLL